MINTHKEFISEIKNFVDKFDFINSFVYIKDAEDIVKEIEASEPRTFVIGLSSMEVDAAEYNNIMKYDFILSDETLYDEDAILESETENIFCVTALSDYLNHIANTGVELSNLNFITESLGKGSYTSVTGSFDFVIKGKASYWKVMDSYSV